LEGRFESERRLPRYASRLTPVPIPGGTFHAINFHRSALRAIGILGRIQGREYYSGLEMSDPNRRQDDEQGTGVVTKTRTRTKRPSLYRVLLLNDDYTPMEFVVIVLERFFQKGREDATRIMLHVHQHGVGECGIYTYEVAETKVTQVMDFARKHQHPLQCVMEKK
jgi:ATP-dependent Clp protease adaptor protein ClpS